MLKNDQSPKVSGVLGFFNDPETLLEATAKVRDSKFKNFDAFTPYPVHGLEHAQGLKRSKVGYVTGTLAFTGTATAFWLQYNGSYTWWPHLIGGKPFNSLPAFVPIMFELSILFGGIATFLAMVAFNRLPNFSKKAFDPSLTNDRFAIYIEGSETADAESFLKQIGAKDVRQVAEEGWFT